MLILQKPVCSIGGGTINPLAAGIKCCWKFTTVSPSYLDELSRYSNGLEYLFAGEKAKGVGILNGIDTSVWNPETDSMIGTNYSASVIKKGKAENKKWICKEFGLPVSKPLVAFIGRLAGEKGADLLPGIINRAMQNLDGQFSFLILGSGDQQLEQKLSEMKDVFKNYNVFIGYNEGLSHRIYAGADFLLMPSRVEPCGLNQLYAMRYGTVPVVRSTGGLKDTVIDIQSAENGYGICFNNLTEEDAAQAIARAVELYANTSQLQLLRKRMMSLDFSWDKSAQQYIKLYNSLTF